MISKMGFLVLVATLLASCSVVNKNGYYQSRKYNLGKVKIKKQNPKLIESQSTENFTYRQEVSLLDELETEPLAMQSSSESNLLFETLSEEKTLPFTQSEQNFKSARRKVQQNDNSAISRLSNNTIKPILETTEDAQPVEKEEPFLAYASLGLMLILVFGAFAGIATLSGLAALILVGLAASIAGFKSKRIRVSTKIRGLFN